MSALKTEHPDWVAPKDFDLDKLKAEGCEDMAWHNDAFPFFGDWKRGYTLGVDYVEEKSEFKGQDVEFVRYHLSKRELAEGDVIHYREEDYKVFEVKNDGTILANPIDCPPYQEHHVYKFTPEMEIQHECLHDDAEHVLSTDKFQDVLDHLKGKGAS